MSVPLSEWLALLEKEYLTSFVPAGGAAVKIVVAAPERAGEVLARVEEATLRCGLLAARADAAQTRVAAVEQVFFAAARQVEWENLAQQWLRARFVENGFVLENAQGLPDLDELAAQQGLRAQDVWAQAQRWIVNGILKNYRLSKEFRTAMAMLCHATLNPQNVSPSDASVILQWLRGEKVNLAVLKRLQIYSKIARHNARLMLASLAIWLHENGQGGLVLLLDINAVTRDDLPGEAPVRYSRNAALDFYEVLRQFIDDTDEVEHFLLVAAAGPGFVEHPKKGMENYTALKMRVADEVRDKNRSNPLNALVRLA